MKKYFYFIIIFLYGMPLHAETIRMGFFQLKPHAFVETDSKKPIGASIDYFNTLAEKMGYDVAWAGPAPFLRLTKELKDGTLDGAIIYSKNPEREKYLYYSNAYIFKTRTVLAILKNNPLNEIKSVDDIRNYKIGFLKGGHISPFIKNNINKFEMDLLPGKDWVKQNLLKLNSGRLDGVYDLNEYTLRYVMHQINLKHQFKILFLPEEPNAAYPVFSKASPIGKKLQRECNEVVKTYSHNYDDFIINFLN